MNDQNLSHAEIENLVCAAKSDDAKATNQLIAYCEQLVRAEIAKLHPKPATLTYDELMQTGRVAVWQALRAYNPERRSWLGYVQRAIRRALWRDKDREIKRTSIEHTGESSDIAQECNYDQDRATPIDRLEAIEDCNERERAIKQELSHLEVGLCMHEVARRRELNRPLEHDAPLPEKQVKPLNRDRLALLTLILRGGTFHLPVQDESA